MTPQYSWVHKLIKLESILEVSVFLAKWYFLNKLNFCSLNDDLTAFGPSCIKLSSGFEEEDENVKSLKQQNQR